MSRKKIHNKVVQLLKINSGNQCNFCGVTLLKKETSGEIIYIGQMAHVNGYTIDGARAIPDDLENNTYDNLILLCSNCHKKVDDAPRQYPADELKKIKKEHIINIDRKQEYINADVPFKEYVEILEILSTQNSVSSCIIPTLDYEVTPIQAKIDKNHLSTQATNQIKAGLTRYKDIDTTFNQLQKERPKLIPTVVYNFKSKYYSLKSNEQDENKVFNDLIQYASQGNTDDSKILASAAVIVFLFIKCEIFEK